MTTHRTATVAPRPRLILNGQTLACGLDESEDVPVVLDGLAVNWGRDDIWDEPATTTATVTLLDRAGIWAAKIAAAEAVGAPLALFADATGFTHLVFQGSVSEVRARPRSRTTLSGAWIVTLTVSDPTGPLGDQQTAVAWPGEWPHERLVDRAVRAKAIAAIGDLYFNPERVNSRVAPWDPDGSVRDLINHLYSTTASSWTYVPHESCVRSVDRIRPTNTLRLARRPATGTSRYLATITTPPGPYDPGSSSTPPPSASLGACVVTGTAEDMTQTKTQAITRVVMKWHNWANANGDEIHTYAADTTAPFEGGGELVHESWLSDGLDVDPIVQDTLNRARDEGRRPLHPPIVYDTDLTGGGFPDADTARRCLTPAETNGIVTVPGSPFADWLGYPPTFRPSGGRIEYRRGRWITRFTLQWLETYDTSWSPRWVDLGHENRLTWAGTDTTLDESITYATLEHASLAADWNNTWS